MAKAVVCVSSTDVDDSGNINMHYTVSVLGPPTYSYGSSYIVNTGITVNANLNAWKNQVIAQAAERSVTLAGSDVIVFGVPA